MYAPLVSSNWPLCCHTQHARNNVRRHKLWNSSSTPLHQRGRAGGSGVPVLHARPRKEPRRAHTPPPTLATHPPLLRLPVRTRAAFNGLRVGNRPEAVLFLVQLLDEVQGLLQVVDTRRGHDGKGAHGVRAPPPTHSLH